MKGKLIIFTVILYCIGSGQTKAQYKQGTLYKKHFIGSTLFLLGNLDTKNNPGFVQLNVGYRITPKDVLSLELKTWRYRWSLGIPYGKSFEAPDERFPGSIREHGFALVYQRFLWKGLYSSIHAMSSWQAFKDEKEAKIDNGFQLFNTYRVGYHVKLFKDRFFLQPSIAVTHRMYHTTMPHGFKELDDKWSKFFWGEPGLHFGYNF